jgi:hypothetical protein
MKGVTAVALGLTMATVGAAPGYLFAVADPLSLAKARGPNLRANSDPCARCNFARAARKLVEDPVA